MNKPPQRSVPTCSCDYGWGRLFMDAYALTVPLAEGVVWVGEFGLSEASSLALPRGLSQGVVWKPMVGRRSDLR